MRLFMCILLVVAVSASAGVRTGGSGTPNPWSSNGTYTIVDIQAGGLTNSYGLAIKDTAANSAWILNWGDMLDVEIDMAGGSPTGTTWAITGGVDPDDQAFCEYTSGDQWFLTDYSGSWFGVFAEDGTWLRNVDGPSGYTNLFGIGAGNDMLYVGSPNESALDWGSYTGAETSVTWTSMTYEDVYGLAVWGDYLFVACGVAGSDNIFIHDIAADGTPGATPVWSCNFVESATGELNGGIDYDGTHLWVYPQNDFLYKLDIDFIPGALEADTWAGVKTSF
ncbi:MAG: hypothetical protein KAH54_07510 [Candidatus Sabulitectum sp.]|nr:hypothetical protein [Candidatus Sabulitectum sp.]